MTQVYSDIVACIIATISIVAVFVMFYIDCKTDKLREEHIKTLNEHDKAVIMDYKNTKYHFTKKKNENKN